MVETAHSDGPQSLQGAAPAPTSMRTFFVIWIG